MTVQAAARFCLPILAMIPTCTGSHRNRRPCCCCSRASDLRGSGCAANLARRSLLFFDMAHLLILAGALFATCANFAGWSGAQSRRYDCTEVCAATRAASLSGSRVGRNSASRVPPDALDQSAQVFGGSLREADLASAAQGS